MFQVCVTQSATRELDKRTELSAKLVFVRDAHMLSSVSKRRLRHTHTHTMCTNAHKQNVPNVFIFNDEQNVIDLTVGLECIRGRFKVFISLTFFIREIKCVFPLRFYYTRSIFLKEGAHVSFKYMSRRNAEDTYIEFRINGSLDHERGKNL